MRNMMKAATAYIWTQTTLDILDFAVRLAILAGTVWALLAIFDKVGL